MCVQFNAKFVFRCCTVMDRLKFLNMFRNLKVPFDSLLRNIQIMCEFSNR